VRVCVLARNGRRPGYGKRRRRDGTDVHRKGVSGAGEGVGGRGRQWHTVARVCNRENVHARGCTGGMRARRARLWAGTAKGRAQECGRACVYSCVIRGRGERECG